MEVTVKAIRRMCRVPGQPAWTPPNHSANPTLPVRARNQGNPPPTSPRRGRANGRTRRTGRRDSVQARSLRPAIGESGRVAGFAAERKKGAVIGDPCGADGPGRRRGRGGRRPTPRDGHEGWSGGRGWFVCPRARDLGLHVDCMDIHSWPAGMVPRFPTLL